MQPMASNPGKEKTMADMNSINISGRLGADPESRGPSSDKVIATFRVCVNGRRKEGEEWVDVPNWFSITAFGWQGRILLEKGHKGDEVVVAGKLREETWEVNGEKKNRVSIIADNIKVIPRGQPTQSISSNDDVPF